MLTGRYAMTGMGLLTQDLLGLYTYIYGGACTPGTGLAVNIAPARIYAQAPIEATQWSSLATVSSTMTKQGIMLNSQAFSVPAPTTAGQSITYLVEMQYTDSDTDNATLSYYNSSNPQQPFSGAGNNGIAQSKTRAGYVAVQVLAGTSATTGTQTAPALTSGWVPAYLVTVAYGASSITTGNIVVAPNAPFASGSFSVTAAGFSGTAPTGLCYYTLNGPLVTLTLPVVSATSSGNTFTFNSLPIFLTSQAPANQIFPLGVAVNNSSNVAGGYAVIQPTSGTITLGLLGSFTGWTASGTKSAVGTFTYRLY